jgi:hypothetical protein
MNVEVGVHFQKTARLDLMEATATEVRIGNQPFNACELFEEEEHLEAIHRIQKPTHRIADRARLVEEAKLLLLWIVEARPTHRLRCGKVVKDRVEIVVIE